MKLLLLVSLLGLVALATGKRDVIPSELEELDVDGVVRFEDLEENVDKAVRLLDGYFSNKTLRKTLRFPKDAPDYLDKYKGGKASKAFRVKATRGAAQVGKVQTITDIACGNPLLYPYYHCPHRTYTLYWFFNFNDGFCFVPFAWIQRITYARCIWRHCCVRSPFSFKYNGWCYRSCWQVRYVYALCFKNGRWSWGVRRIYLPQACRCGVLLKFLPQ